MRKVMVVTLFLMFVFMFVTFSFVSAAITDDLHLNIQATDGSGDIESGTFDFVFNVSTTSDCNVSNVVYTNSTSLTTDSRGIVSYYLPNVTLDYDAQYYLCYYRNGSLESSSKLARVPYAFRATDVNLSEVTIDENLDLTSYNVSTTNTGFFGFLGSLTNRVTKLFVQDIDFSGSINGSGNITTAGNVSADYFFGDGSQLTNLPSVSGTVNSTSWNRSGTNVFLANSGDSVGIGTSTPQQELNVIGDGNFTGNVSFGGLILYGENTGAGAVLNEQTSSTNPTLVPSRSNLGYGLGYGSQSLHLIVNDLNIFELFSDRANLNANLSVDGNVTADYFFGDGSQLTGLSFTNTSYYLATNPFGFYNSTTLQNVSQLTNDAGYIDWSEATNGTLAELSTILGFNYYNLTDFDINDYRTLTNLTFIGDTSILGNLSVNTGDNSTIPFWVLGNNGTGSSVTFLYIQNSTGFVGVGTSTPQQELNVIGDINGTGNVTTDSYFVGDGRFITNIASSGLSVNSSDYWDSYDVANSTQFENNGGTLNIIVSWLESLFISDSDEGNLNVNSSNYWDGLDTPADITSLTGLTSINSTDWSNVSITGSQVTDDGTYLLATGDTASGDYNFSNTLFVNSTNERVGIGTSNPEGKLHTTGGDVIIEI